MGLGFNKDRLRGLSGGTPLGYSENLLILGKIAVKPQPMRTPKVRIEGNELRIKDATYTAEYGNLDYGVIYVSCEGLTTWDAGLTRYGTGAALMWMLENPDELMAVEWIDGNNNGQVDPQEIRAIYTLPLILNRFFMRGPYMNNICFDRSFWSDRAGRSVTSLGLSHHQ